MALAAVAVINARHHNALTQEFESASQGAKHVERLNGLIYAVAMESRGIYMSPDTDAVVLTGKSSLETAVAALRHGAFDYLGKPCKLADLENLLRRVADKRELTNKYRALKRRLEGLEGAAGGKGERGASPAPRPVVCEVRSGPQAGAPSVWCYRRSLRRQMPRAPVAAARSAFRR